MKLIKKRKLNEVYTRYDLSIKNTHNFIAEDIVVHNTSAHIKYSPSDSKVTFFSGGCSHLEFCKLFNKEEIEKRFLEKAIPEEVFIYGEAYGGKLQGMSKTYGDKLSFIAFEVKIGDSWLSVPRAEVFVTSLNLPFVHYTEISTDLEAIDSERDAPSVQAKRNGILEDKMREGVVLRPLIEVTLNNGKRIIVKHKRDEFKETATKRIVGEELQVLTEAKQIADEWVTEERLTHILTGNCIELDIANTGKVIKLMTDDIFREAGIEIVSSKAGDKEIGRATTLMFKRRLKEII